MATPDGTRGPELACDLARGVGMAPRHPSLNDYLKIPPGESRSRQVGSGKGSGEPALSLSKGRAPQKLKTLWAGGGNKAFALLR